MGRVVYYDWQGNEVGPPLADPVPVTNADKIRAMSDEELANHFAFYKFICPANIENSEQCIKECEKCWMNWLQQEAVPDD